MLSRAGKLSTNQKSRMIQLKTIFMQCRRGDDGAIFEPPYHHLRSLVQTTQKPINLETVHSSPNISDSTVGIIIKLRLNTVNTKCLVYLTSRINTSKPSTTTPPATSCSQMIGRANNLTSLFMVFFGLFSSFSNTLALYGQIQFR